MNIPYIVVTLTCSALLITGCTNFQSLEEGTRTPGHSAPPVITEADADTRLQQSFARYEGTPYRYGGTDASGFDCSGFINAVYEEAYGIDLPRTTEQIARAGSAIRRDQLRAGDIVFFKTSDKQLHAGIYSGNGRFIHSSTSKGVIESDLNNQYWHQRYLQSRRYL